MIIEFRTYESMAHKVGIVGIPSGEYLELDSEEFMDVNNVHMIVYKPELKAFIFDDKDYDNIMYYVKNSKIYNIKKFLNKIGLKKYKINSDYTVDTYEDVFIREKIEHIPIKFDYVDGDFDCSHCGLISLMGCPEEISGDFIASNNNLPDLYYGPKIVSGDYDVSNNKITTLKGAPLKIFGDFNCSRNSMKKLYHSPVAVEGDFDCSSCLINDLDGVTDDIGGDFNCSYNYLKSLKNGPDIINGTYDCSFNQIESLENGPDAAEIFKCNNNKIKDLSLAPIDCVRVISYKQNP